MELQFKETRIQACQDLARLTKSFQLAMESVVPDTREDIGRILSVWPEIYLKSKEARNKSVFFTGEAAVTVLYVNEDESGVSAFRMSQVFNQEYELSAVEEGDDLQLRFSVAGLQARVLNPRKVSVDLEIGTDLLCSRRAGVVIQQELPETVSAPIHLQQSDVNVVLTTGISEKNFSVNEQISLADCEASPYEIIGKQLEYRIREKEAVSNRLLLKGDVQLTLFYFPEDSRLPCSCRLSIPFSQLIDLGDENTEAAEIWIEPSSDYINLIDSLDGKKLLDVELHALAQLRSRRSQQMRLISDAYSNQMPCECVFIEQPMTESIREKQFMLQCEERIDLPQEFQEILSAYPALGPCTEKKGSAAVDLLCRSRDGKLFSIRRTVSLNPDENIEDLSSLSFRLSDFQLRQDGAQLLVQMQAEGLGLNRQPVTIRRADTLILNEEQLFDSASFPSLTAVWARTESIWEMAKEYHSSPEAICDLNQDLSQRPIFVPKTK